MPDARDTAQSPADTGAKDMMADTGSKDMMADTGSKDMMVDTGSKDMMADTGSKDMMADTASTDMVSVLDPKTVALGKKVFRKCMACHAVGPDAQSKIGPVLNGVIGREVASIEGFKYSAAFKEAGSAGQVWTQESIKAFLQKPKEAIPGTAMNFIGLRRAKDQVNIVAYLESFNADGSQTK